MLFLPAKEGECDRLQLVNMKITITCGEITILGTIISSIVSACVSGCWGRCMFISSPSKSALYGDVTAKFNRKVE